jgi:hypothetical protein
MEMYGVPRGEVEDFLRTNGARIVAVVRNDASGPGWVSYRYCVTK